PGVTIRSYGGLGQLSTISIRGSTAAGVRVLLDGIPLDTAAGGGVDLSSIPLHWVDRVEVVRGAEGAYFGAGATGGAVNVITRQAVAGKWGVELTGGSFGTATAVADVGLGDEHWAVLAALTASTTQGDFPFLTPSSPSVPDSPLVEQVRSNDAASQGGLLVKGKWVPGLDRLDGVVQLSWGWRQLPGVPAAPTPDDWQRGGRASGALRWSRLLGSGLTLEAGLAGRYEVLDVQVSPPGGSGMTDQKDLAGGGEARVTWEAGPSLLSVGALASAERLDSTASGDHERPTFAGWASDDFTIGRDVARVSPAVRVDAVGPYVGVSAKLGASVRVAGPLSVRASGGRSYRPPSFSELYLVQGPFQPNPDLRPEVAWSVDGALVYDGPLGRASVGGFGSLYDDLIVYEPGLVPGSFKPQNTLSASAAGLELEAISAAWKGAWNLQGQLSYTFMATDVLRGVPGVVGKELPQRPRNRLFARASVDPGPAGGHVEAQFVGAQWLDARNLHAVPASVVVNAGAFARILKDPEVRIGAEVKNLLDDMTLQDGFGYPLPSRTLLVTVRVGTPPENGR
ncbi:MAG TPA: TonB-dependent receptor, partial [Anaeromyxobacteraceae bacterium]|nr:TonB-dependent receptor [Anaeromyxobacteraceae bacterium]